MTLETRTRAITQWKVAPVVLGNPEVKSIRRCCKTRRNRPHTVTCELGGLAKRKPPHQHNGGGGPP